MSSEDGFRPPRRTLWYRFIQGFAKLIIIPVYFTKNHVKVEMYRPKRGEPVLFLHNHLMDDDFILTAAGLNGYTRFILSDAFTRKPLIALIVEIVSDFIYRRKGDNADAVVKSIAATFEKGINMTMAPEGEESPNGVTAPIRKRTGQMIKDLNVPIVTYRLEGGYFIRPTWSRNRAKGGPMFGKVIGVYSKEQLSEMTADEINDLIYRDLYINHYDWVKENGYVYDRECRAECMERALFICPHCKTKGSMHSHKDTLFCGECGYSVDVDEHGLFVGENVIFDNLYDWDQWQKESLKAERIEWSEHPDEPIFTDTGLKLSVLSGNEPQVLGDDVTLTMSFNEICIKGNGVDLKMPIGEISGIALANTDTAGINFGGNYYLVKSRIPLCVRKYRYIRKMILDQY